MLVVCDIERVWVVHRGEWRFFDVDDNEEGLKDVQRVGWGAVVYIGTWAKGWRFVTLGSNLELCRSGAWNMVDGRE